MEYEDIKEGDMVEFIAKIDFKKAVYSSSTITEISNQQKIFTIVCPRINNTIMRFSKNEPYIFCFYENNQCYSCECLFSREKKVENKYYATFRVVSGFSKIERRNSSRIQLTIPVRYSMVKNDGSLVDPDNTMEGICLNISNGGVRFANDRILDVGEKIYLMLEKPSGPIATKAVVVNQSPVAIRSAGEYPYNTSVRFVEKQDSRRKNDRYSCDYPLKYRIINDSSISEPEQVHEGTLRDISKGGMRFAGNVGLIKNIRLTCSISSPGVLLMADAVVTSEKSRLTINGEYMFETSVRFTKVTQSP